MSEEIEVTSWADKVAEEVIAQKKAPFTVHGMWTPSGYFHIGNSRPEIFTPYSVRKALESKGYKVHQRFIADDFDAIDKIPAGVPVKESEQPEYIGKPCYLAPSPFPGYKSWADYFTSEIPEILPKYGVQLEIVSAFEEYQQGIYNDTIIFALDHAKEIVKIWTEIAKSKKEETFLPIQVLCPDCKKITGNVSNWNGKTVNYVCTYCNAQGEIKPFNGNAKLHWRVHWVAHWVHYGVSFESGGKDHFSKGGSVDVGRVLCKEVFKKDPPVQFPTEFIQLKGGAKMSGSAGNVISLKEWEKTASPELFRFMIFSHKPQSSIEFGFDDNSFVLLNENFERAERIYYGLDSTQAEKLTHKIKREYELSLLEKPSEKMPAQISFGFATLLAQILDPKKDINKLEEILLTSGHVKEKLAESDKHKFSEKLLRCQYWIEKYAQEQSKIKFQENPSQEFTAFATNEIKKCILSLSEKMQTKQTAEEIQQMVFETAKGNNIQPKDLFKALYLLLINKDRGPKIGTLIHAFGIEKVKQAFRKV
ncbi:MAG: lysine--tRNA ligase [Candidatus Diapherotrites archaeon]|nr:lysine--tRNA ligase [Candidatus Diapherotrites archaeon]